MKRLRQTSKLTKAGFIAVLAVAVGLLLIAVGGSASTVAIEPSAAQVEEDVASVIPGASASLVPYEVQSGSADELLEVVLAQKPTAQQVSDPFAYAMLGWRARLAAASLAGQVENLTAFRVTAPGVSFDEVPPAARGETEGTLPSAPLIEGESKLGDISEKEALGQLESNLKVLRSTLPDGALDSVSVESVPIDPERNRFAFEVNLTTQDSSVLLPYFGDAFVGLETGLVGGEDAVIDGLAITLRQQGKPIAGSWVAARALSGTQMVAPGLGVPDEVTTTLEFPNLTGGPSPHGYTHADGIGSLPSLPTGKRIYFKGDIDAAYSAPGFVSTPEQGSSVAERYKPRIRPELQARPGSSIVVSFTAPAVRAPRIVVQRPSRDRNSGVVIAHPRVTRADENGLRWRFTLPTSARLERATTIYVTCAYPGGVGRYSSGLHVRAG